MGPLCDDGSSNNGPSVATVEVTGSSTSFSFLGATAQLQSTAKDSGGSTISGQTFVWSSTDVNVVTVNGSGLATAVGNGTATITATTGGVQGSITLTVSQTVAAIAVTPEGPLGFSLLGETGSPGGRG